MDQHTLTFSLLQTTIAWEDKAANLRHYEHLIKSIEGHKEIVVLPEMFSTGFSMAPERLAEPMDGPTITWMKAMSRQHRIILTGSLMIEEDGKYYNRLVWMQPDGRYYCYDKRHLFGYGDEDQHYTAGNKKVIVQVKGWKICPLICYDLRFPVWARNGFKAAGSEEEQYYDVLLYTANWPERRQVAWKTLLQARAIENQAYVIGLNRLGTDGQQIVYAGDTAVFDPLGAPVLAPTEADGIHTIVLDKAMLNETRSHFPFLKDKDDFLLL